MFPQTIHHYYERAKGPFRSMSELADADCRTLMEELGELATVENRFDTDWKREFYLPFRRYVEASVRRRFEGKGGKPRDFFPQYFTLGPAAWFEDWYVDAQEVVVPLEQLPPELVSFTLPDSMMSFLIAEDRFEPFATFKQPHHGEVFTLAEIRQFVLEQGLPDETDLNNIAYGNRIVEAQVWDVELLRSLQDC